MSLWSAAYSCRRICLLSVLGRDHYTPNMIHLHSSVTKRTNDYTVQLRFTAFTITDYNLAWTNSLATIRIHSSIHPTMHLTSFSVLPECRHILILSCPLGTVGWTTGRTRNPLVCKCSASACGCGVNSGYIGVGSRESRP